MNEEKKLFDLPEEYRRSASVQYKPENKEYNSSVNSSKLPINKIKII